MKTFLFGNTVFVAVSATESRTMTLEQYERHSRDATFVPAICTIPPAEDVVIKQARTDELAAIAAAIAAAKK